jgi:hypothetical protein
MAIALYPIGRFIHPMSPAEFLGGVRPKRDRWPYEQKFHESGWVESDRKPHKPDSYLEKVPQLYEHNRVSEAAVGRVLQYVAKWSQSGVRVFGFVPPRAIEVMELEEDLSGFDRESFVRGFTESGGRWLDIDPTPYQSYDGSHLAGESAVRLSELIGSKIAEASASNER